MINYKAREHLFSIESSLHLCHDGPDGLRTCVIPTLHPEWLATRVQPERG